MYKSRQSNFELLRILAILMVVMGHFIRQSGLLESETGANGTINIFLGSGARIAVNIFLLIGSWFTVDSVSTPGKALRLYLETAFYCIPITLLMTCLGTAGGARNILQGLLPFFGRGYNRMDLSRSHLFGRQAVTSAFVAVDTMQHGMNKRT